MYSPVKGKNAWRTTGLVWHEPLHSQQKRCPANGLIHLHIPDFDQNMAYFTAILRESSGATRVPQLFLC